MIRSVLLSTAIYVVASIGTWALFLLAKGHGASRLAGLVQYAILSGVAVGLSGLLVWPLLRAMRRLRRGAVLAAGALLAAVPMAVLMTVFWEDEDSLAGLLRFWLRVPGEFLLGFGPMALATGALAWFATAQPKNGDRSAPRGGVIAPSE